MITFKNKCITITEEIQITFNYGSPSKNSKTRACMKHHENSTITALKSVCVCVCVCMFLNSTTDLEMILQEVTIIKWGSEAF